MNLQRKLVWCSVEEVCVCLCSSNLVVYAQVPLGLERWRADVGIRPVAPGPEQEI